MKSFFKKISLLGLALTFFAPPLAFAELVLPPAPQGYVLDSANILSAETITTLETELAKLDTETSTQIVVVTVLSLQGYEPEQFALELGRAWGIGQEEFNNGLVFLIAPTEHDVRIEVGYGLEGAIPDATAWQIIDNLALPAFQNGDYNAGTLGSIQALDTLARGEVFDIPAPAENTNNVDIGAFIQILIFFFLFALGSLARTKSWWLGGVLGGILGIVILQSWIGFAAFAVAGLIFDFLASKYLPKTGGREGFFGGFGGRGGSGGGGGFGGFGGGGFGGGGVGGHW